MSRAEVLDPSAVHVVYVIRDDADQVVYVGMTSDLEERLYSHHLSYRLRWPHHPYMVEAIETTDRAAARTLEAELIRSYRPSENTALTRAS
jgi:predicted GIY-YIG superfamily endonuclease